MLVSEITIVWLPALVGVALLTGLRRVRKSKAQLTDAVASVDAQERDGAGLAAPSQMAK